MLPGRQLPPECHAELHTDYGGAAVRWGLTHHKESAYDCCMACLDHARRAKPGQRKCNIWVYCPSETGCFSPDVYNHKYRECWLKYVSLLMKSNSHLAVEVQLIVIVLQSETPQSNFKDRYSEAYRDAHPRAPLVVPWVSGVVGWWLVVGVFMTSGVRGRLSFWTVEAREMVGGLVLKLEARAPEVGTDQT